MYRGLRPVQRCLPGFRMEPEAAPRWSAPVAGPSSDPRSSSLGAACGSFAGPTSSVAPEEGHQDRHRSGKLALPSPSCVPLQGPELRALTLLPECDFMSTSHSTYFKVYQTRKLGPRLHPNRLGIPPAWTRFEPAFALPGTFP